MIEDLRTSTWYEIQLIIEGRWFMLQRDETLEDARAALNLRMEFAECKKYNYRIVKVTETRDVVE